MIAICSYYNTFCNNDIILCALKFVFRKDPAASSVTFSPAAQKEEEEQVAPMRRTTSHSIHGTSPLIVSNTRPKLLGAKPLPISCALHRIALPLAKHTGTSPEIPCGTASKSFSGTTSCVSWVPATPGCWPTRPGVSWKRWSRWNGSRWSTPTRSTTPRSTRWSRKTAPRSSSDSGSGMPAGRGGAWRPLWIGSERSRTRPDYSRSNRQTRPTQWTWSFAGRTTIRSASECSAIPRPGIGGIPSSSTGTTPFCTPFAIGTACRLWTREQSCRRCGIRRRIGATTRTKTVPKPRRCTSWTGCFSNNHLP